MLFFDVLILSCFQYLDKSIFPKKIENLSIIFFNFIKDSFPIPRQINLCAAHDFLPRNLPQTFRLGRKTGSRNRKWNWNRRIVESFDRRIAFEGNDVQVFGIGEVDRDVRTLWDFFVDLLLLLVRHVEPLGRGWGVDDCGSERDRGLRWLWHEHEGRELLGGDVGMAGPELFAYSWSGNIELTFIYKILYYNGSLV